MILHVMSMISLLFAISIADDDKFSYQVNLINLQNQTSHNYSPTKGLESKVAIDGDLRTCTHIGFSPLNEVWWKIDLDRIYKITHIRLLYEKDSNLWSFAYNLRVNVQNGTERHELCAYHPQRTFQTPEGYLELKCGADVFGRTVVIKKSEEFLVLCEVHIFSDIRTINLALKRPFDQDGPMFSKTIALTVDGDQHSCGVIISHTNELPWLRVILDKIYYVTDVNLFFPKPNKRLERHNRKYVNIFLSEHYENYEERLCVKSSGSEYELLPSGLLVALSCKTPTPGNFLTVKNYDGLDSQTLVICEMEVFARGFKPANDWQKPPSTSCLSHEYQCLKNLWDVPIRCIHKDWLCDGTNDCLLADDEPVSCHGDKTKFKCKRFKTTINIENRCDGVWDCPDYSDEEHCFDWHEEFTTATFKGESNFYICRDGWNEKYSKNICNEIDRDYMATSYSFNDIISDGRKLIRLKKDHTLTNTTDFMALFEISSTCGFRVDIFCVSKARVYTCGTRPSFDEYYGPYVINGQNTILGAWPWNAQVKAGTKYKRVFCGGTLIKDKWILTLASCFDDYSNPKNIEVTVGSFTHSHYFDELPVTHIIKHPEYNPELKVNDIALLRLEKYPVYTRNIKPVCLPTKELDHKSLMSYRYCMVTGYGWTDRKGTVPDELQQARMNIIENKICAQQQAEFFKPFDTGLTWETIYNKLVNNNHFCAGQIPLKDGANHCLEDGGSALVCKGKNGIWTQVGMAISSHLPKNVPYENRCSVSLFIKIDRYLDFIHTTMDSFKAIAQMRSTMGRIYKSRFDILLYFIMSIIFNL